MVTKILMLGIAAGVLSMIWAPRLGAVPSSAVSRSGPKASPRQFASPVQPWVSPDGNVHLLRPITAIPGTTDTPVSTLISPGWRLTWDGSPIGLGQPVVKLILKVRPAPPLKTASEILQIGVSRASDVVHSCLTYGLAGGSGQRQPDRLINGRTYVVWTNGDAGMSQQVIANDLRAVVNGACYAIDRLRVSEGGSDGDPAVTLPEATGAQELDAALSSLQLGPMAKDQVLRPQTGRMPPGTYAR